MSASETLPARTCSRKVEYGIWTSGFEGGHKNFAFQMSNTSKTTSQSVNCNLGGRWLSNSLCCFPGVVGFLSGIIFRLQKNGLHSHYGWLETFEEICVRLCI